MLYLLLDTARMFAKAGYLRSSYGANDLQRLDEDLAYIKQITTMRLSDLKFVKPVMLAGNNR